MSDYGIRIRRGCQSGSAPGVSRLAIGRRHLSQLVADLVLERLGTVDTWTRVLGLPDHAELQAAGLTDVPPHDLRHTAASLAVASGAHVKLVQQLLGRASAAMTLDVYAALFDDDLGALAERMDAASAPTVPT